MRKNGASTSEHRAQIAGKVVFTPTESKGIAAASDASCADGEVRWERVLALRAAIASGRYRVPSADVAESFVRALFSADEWQKRPCTLV